MTGHHLAPHVGLTLTDGEGTAYAFGSGLLFAFGDQPPRPPTARLDPDGKPYGWSFTCADCDMVYVREENPNPSHDHAMAVMAAHADEHHPGWRER